MSEPREWPAQRYSIYSMETVGGEHEGVVNNLDGLNAYELGERVKACIEAIENGESIELRFTRHDMTRAEYDAIPEV